MNVSTENGQSSMASHERDGGITLLAAYHFVVAGMFLLGTIFFAIVTAILGVVTIVEEPDAFIGLFAVGLIGAVAMSFCLIYLTVGYGLWKLKQWGRVSAIALAIISLFFVPIGTVIGIITLWYLLKSEIADGFT